MTDTIITFDGQFWDINDLTQKAVEDDFYYGYLADNVLSSSSCKDLYKSPKKFWLNRNSPQSFNQTALDEGKIIHWAILEPHKLMENVRTTESTDRRTKAYKTALMEAIDEGKTLVGKDRYEELMKLADSVIKHPIYKEEQINDYNPEVPAIGTIADVPFRAKADLLLYQEGSNAIVDLKTTSDIQSFKYSAYKYGYDLQVYIYCQLFGIYWEDFKFLVLDKTTGDVGLFEVSEEFYLSGEKKTLKAVENYKRHFIHREPLTNHLIKGVL